LAGKRAGSGVLDAGAEVSLTAGRIYYLLILPNRRAWMKTIGSFLLFLGLMILALTGIHYLALIMRLSDLSALLLFALPVVTMIAYCNHEVWHDMIRQAVIIYICFASVTLAAAGLVLFIG